MGVLGLFAFVLVVAFPLPHRLTLGACLVPIRFDLTLESIRFDSIRDRVAELVSYCSKVLAPASSKTI